MQCLVTLNPEPRVLSIYSLPADVRGKADAHMGDAHTAPHGSNPQAQHVWIVDKSALLHRLGVRKRLYGTSSRASGPLCARC